MPVTSFGSSPVGQGQGATPAAAPPAAAAPPPSASAPVGVVGHGVTRLMARAPAFGVNVKFVPGAPPPTRETAGAHGAHKGRISIR
ncbi:MAG: hypothetical protein QOE31_1190 [Solirubrobacteraceae bacterium]|nr:hypothetical protein [Solirubrobacteraceae bacterium]